MVEFIERGDSPEPGEDVVALSEARLHAPVPNPQKIIGIGLNYADHARRDRSRDTGEADSLCQVP